MSNRWLLLGVAFAIGCTGHGSTPTGDDDDPCAGLGCASGPGTLTLTVLDQTTQQPVAGDVMFSAQGQALPFACSAMSMPCPSWQLTQEGTFDVDVVAPGFQPATIQIVIEGPEGCCGLGPDTTASLSLSPL